MKNSSKYHVSAKAYSIIKKYSNIKFDKSIEDTRYVDAEIDKDIISVIEYINLLIDNGKFNFTLTDNQYDALISVGQSIGIEALAGIVESGDEFTIETNILSLVKDKYEFLDIVSRRYEEYFLFKKSAK